MCASNVVRIVDMKKSAYREHVFLQLFRSLEHLERLDICPRLLFWQGAKQYTNRENNTKICKCNHINDAYQTSYRHYVLSALSVNFRLFLNAMMRLYYSD